MYFYFAVAGWCGTLGFWWVRPRWDQGAWVGWAREGLLYPSYTSFSVGGGQLRGETGVSYVAR